jgi:hypothetical protein
MRGACAEHLTPTPCRFFFVPQDRDFDAQRVGEGRLGEHGLVGLVGAVGVGDLDVVGLVPAIIWSRVTP